MRDGLLKLLDEAINDESTSYSNIVDYLLENGVIVLPVKVGDKIYQTDGFRVYENEVCEISLSKRTVIYYTESAVAFDETAISKSVFLTREEAEQALKGGEG